MALVLTALPAAAYRSPGRTERVSVGDDGSEGNGAARHLGWTGPALSADARYVAFESQATNLVPGDTNEVVDIFVRDRVAGTTERVSVSSDGSQAEALSWMPKISLDGRYVAFVSDATNLAPDAGEPDPFKHNLYLRDRLLGTTRFVALGDRPSISADGRYVAYDDFWQVYVWNRENGESELVSVDSEGFKGNASSIEPAISADGSVVVFVSSSSNLAREDPDTEGDVFVHDRGTGKTDLASISTEGDGGNGPSLLPAVSGNGRYVAFWSYATNFVPNQDVYLQMFVYDRNTEATEMVSVTTNGEPGEWWSWGTPALSHDGRFVAFRGGGGDLVAEDVNGDWDVFVRDRVLGRTELISVTSEGEQTPAGDTWNHTGPPAITPDGRHVAFDSAAYNLVPEDSNGNWDVFLRDRGPSVGPGILDASPTPTSVMVSGWVRLGGAVVASVADHPGDVELGNASGGEVKRLRLVSRPEEEDLLVRLDVADIPGVRDQQNATFSAQGASGHPGVVYAVEMRVGGVLFQARAAGAAEYVRTPSRPIALFRCEAICTEVARLRGGIGTTGQQVWMSIPLAALGMAGGAAILDGVRTVTGYGDLTTGPVRMIDELDVGSVGMPASSLAVGVAPSGTPQEEVDFREVSAVENGRFEAEVPGAPANGDYDVWARACLGLTCGTSVARLRVGP